MPNTREKLIELLNAVDGVCPKDASCYDCEYKDVVHCAIPAKADYLIANGVTVQADNDSYAKGYVFAAKACTAINAFIDSKVLDGKEYEDAELYYQDFAQELEKLYTNYEKAEKWIPVTERLPENGNVVVGYMTFGEFRTLKCKIATHRWEGVLLDYPMDAVTHWMPLPEPPKGE